MSGPEEFYAAVEELDRAERTAGITDARVRHQTVRELWRLASYRFGFYKLPERAQMAVAWRCPHWLVRQCVNRAIAHGTTGAFGWTLVPNITAVEMFKRWDDSRGGDRWAVRHRRRHLSPEERLRAEALLSAKVVNR